MSDESSSGQDTGPEESGLVSWVRWVRRTDNETVVFVREFLETVALVVAIGLVLFAVSGVWPPMVAIESASMEPHMERGDLVFAMDEERLPLDAATGQTGVVTHQQGAQEGYTKFDEPGDVIIYRPSGSSTQTPIIHRAYFWVDEGENWYGKANPSYVDGADDCQELLNCPAPHAGFITKGDNNRNYDQVIHISDPVKPEWIRATAEVRIPWLGYIRLTSSVLGVPTNAHHQPTLRA